MQEQQPKTERSHSQHFEVTLGQCGHSVFKKCIMLCHTHCLLMFTNNRMTKERRKEKEERKKRGKEEWTERAKVGSRKEWDGWKRSSKMILHVTTIRAPETHAGIWSLTAASRLLNLSQTFNSQKGPRFGFQLWLYACGGGGGWLDVLPANNTPPILAYPRPLFI